MFWSFVFGGIALVIFMQLLLNFNTYNHFQIVKYPKITKTKHLNLSKTKLKKVIFCILFVIF